MATAASFRKLSHREHVLHRPGMYMGSTAPESVTTWVMSSDADSDAGTDAGTTASAGAAAGGGRMVRREGVQYVPALAKLIDECITNAVDHSIRLKTTASASVEQEKEKVTLVRRIDVTIDRATGIVEVSNDGDGVPVERACDSSGTSEGACFVPEMVFGQLLTSANYDDDEQRTVGGTNGLGVKICNIMSRWFEVRTADARNRLVFTQRYEDNMSVAHPPVVKPMPKKEKPGTVVRFLPDYARLGLPGGLTDDMYAVLCKRAYDATAVTGTDVSVHLNGARLDVRSFERYVDLYLGAKGGDGGARVYEAVAGADGWEVAVGLTALACEGLQQVSFVNGVPTMRGGKHVDFVVAQICKRLADVIASSNKKASASGAIRPQFIRDNLFVFVRATVPNPTFDSQAKETLTTPASKWGANVTVQLSDRFIERLAKLDGLVDRVVGMSEAAADKTAKKTDGTKRSTLYGIPKLDDAEWAGTARSAQCSLLLTEGDSAKASAVAGLAVVGRQKWGVFPLRGKVMNVCDVSADRVAANAEIAALKKILGLQSGRAYTDVSELRYGRVVLLADGDHDGTHIRGLVMNLFGQQWPSLLKIDGFMCAMLTPVVKSWRSSTGDAGGAEGAGGSSKARGRSASSASSKPGLREFYTVPEFDAWRASLGEDEASKWHSKYFKGLGTSTPEEARDWFRKLSIVAYRWDDASSADALGLAFDKKRADHRKAWLEQGPPPQQPILQPLPLEGGGGSGATGIAGPGMPGMPPTVGVTATVTHDTFVKHDLIHFSIYDVMRSIPSAVDGLKVSQRKALFGCFKRNLIKEEVRVAQLAAYVSEHACFHHGETSMQGTLVGMAQDFVGSNNLPILASVGQFGCLDPDTPVLMWDATRKKAADVSVGDALVGDDGTVRHVLATTAGTDAMYEIKMGRGGSYVVNSQHILTLSQHPDDDDGEAPKIVDIRLEDFLKLPQHVRDGMSCVKNSTPIQWGERPAPIHPYIMGLWLGEGAGVASAADADILGAFAAWKDLLKKQHRFSDAERVTVDYILNDKTARLQLLAGVIDTEGGSVVLVNRIPHVEIAGLSAHIMEAVELVAGSLGYATHLSTRESHSVLTIGGDDLDLIPALLPRKKVVYTPSAHASAPSAHASPFTVTPLGQGRFCGWSVDGNQRFLLGDFTVTHNSRLAGGSDAASARYIHTRLTGLARLLFPKADDAVLEYLDDDGTTVQPNHYLPIVPFVLINGAVGIGTGYSTNVPCYHPLDVVEAVRSRLIGGRGRGRGRTGPPEAEGLRPLNEVSALDAEDPALDPGSSGDNPPPANDTLPLNNLPSIASPPDNIPSIASPPDNLPLAAALRDNLPSIASPPDNLPLAAAPPPDNPTSASGGPVRPPLQPWYRAFKGAICLKRDDGSGPLVSRGAFHRAGPTTVRVTELPLWTWTDDFKAALEALVEREADLRGFTNASFDATVDFTIQFASPEAADAWSKPTAASASATTDLCCSRLETELKLVSPKGLGTTNMHLFDADGRIRKFATADEIVDHFVPVRLKGYAARKAAVLDALERDETVLANRVRFLALVTTGELQVQRADGDEELAADLAARGFDRDPNRVAEVAKADDDAAVDDGPVVGGGGSGGERAYRYLTGMPLSSLTRARKDQLERELAAKREAIDALKRTTPEQMWELDMDAFVAAYVRVYSENDREQEGVAGPSTTQGVEAPKKGKTAAKAVAKPTACVRKNRTPSESLVRRVRMRGLEAGPPDCGLYGLQRQSGIH
jgi:DNA gyrase/topoisomerase IV subunit B